ncbi:uncharacterized protein LOC131857529 [Cryptomeria japonica]|uniref:uncharacterized protein LOC131857529 n=1 Tax=Cryptomeria japonica TaxID=3369 RepID=UPI0027DA19DC|nr:uncharacterized protein LOC131857529 [Cryptomeria japonica]
MGNPIEVIAVETSKEGSPMEDEIQENVVEDKLENLASMALQFEENVEDVLQQPEENMGVDKKKKRLGTFEEKTAPTQTSSAQPSSVKGKKKKMQKHTQSYNDDQIEPSLRLEMDEEETVQDDIVYPIKKKDDTTSQLATQEEPTEKVEEKPSEKEKEQEQEKIEEKKSAGLEKALVKAQKKRIKEQRKEAETIQTIVKILSSLLLKISIGNFSNLIDKATQSENPLVNDVNKEEETQYVVEQKKLDFVDVDPIKENDKLAKAKFAAPSGDTGAWETPKEDKTGQVEVEEKEEEK